MSLWIPSVEDYDSIIKAKLESITVDLDGQGNRQPVHVTYYMPEYQNGTDIDLLRPAIAFYRYDQVHDLKREQSYLTQRISSTDTMVTVKKTPIPIVLMYAFIFLSDYQQHENEMLAQFLKLFPMRGYVSVISPDGETVDYDFFEKGFSSSDTYQVVPNGGSAEQRIFRKVYRYWLYTELDDSTEKTLPIPASGINPNVNTI